MDLVGKTAIITGSTGKIGQALAESLASEGVRCLCHYHRRSRLAERLVQKIRTQGGQAEALQADFRQEIQIRRFFRSVRRLGPADILVHTAALFAKTPLESCTNRQIEDLVHLNLTVPLLLARFFVESLCERKGKPAAKILFFADIGGIRPWKGYSAYCAAKAGLAAAAQSLAKELAPRITVNAIAPGIAEGGDFDWTEALERRKRIPMGKFVSVEDLIEAVLFILKTDSLTGQVLVLDGGLVL